jgi:hypothetical protein
MVIKKKTGLRFDLGFERSNLGEVARLFWYTESHINPTTFACVIGIIYCT